MLKKIFLNILIFLLVFTLVGCGEYTGISNSEGSLSSESVSSSEDSTSEEEEVSVFTVSLIYNKKPFTKAAGMEAQWTDTSGASVHRAAFDENATASVEGLDGDYKVTLLGLPDGYLYNTNANKATNDAPDLTITLYRLSTPDRAGGKGTGRYDAYSINMGVYEAEITGEADPDKTEEPDEKGKEVFFQFVPNVSQSGRYVIESWVDTEANNVNPILDAYTNNASYAKYQYTVNDGSEYSSTYTKNFKYTIEIDESNTSTSGGGGVVYIFAIRATAKDGQYPVRVKFLVSYQEAFAYEQIPSEIIPATELNEYVLSRMKTLRNMNKSVFIQLMTNRGYGANAEGLYQDLQNLTEEQLTNIHMPYSWRNTLLMDVLRSEFDNGGTWTYPDFVKDGVRQFDGSMFRFNDATGFYHVYDAVEYADDSMGYGAGFGPMLYVQITVPTRFFPDYTPPGSTVGIPISFQNIEMPGNKHLSVSVKDEEGNTSLRNHKMFIEGYAALAASYFCDSRCTCEHDIGNVCLPGCANCVKDKGAVTGCRNASAEAVRTLGYAEMVNSDGAFPVNKEMQLFLQQFAISMHYFQDGNGWAETSLQPSIDSAEDDQWLFACGYYI